MTTNNTPSMFNLPTHTITAAELQQSMPKAIRITKRFLISLEPPAAELMAELGLLLGKLNPDDPRKAFHRGKVVAAIFNETNGHMDGFALANAWASKGKTYRGRAALYTYWKTLNLKHKNPVLIRTLKWMVDKNTDGHQTDEADNNRDK